MKQNRSDSSILESITQAAQGCLLDDLVGGDRDCADVLAELARLVRAGQVCFSGNRFMVQGKGDLKLFTDSFGDLARVLEKYSLPDGFPEVVLQQARRCREAGKKETARRKKLEGWIITIDSETAKDLDDAVSVRQLRNGWELGVHIADVSFYVARGSALDREAFARGTSVYLNRHVVPMFPHELSDDLCSLNTDRPKLALSAFLEIDASGKLLSSRFEKTLIHVSRRFSYTEVESILRGKKDPDAGKLQTMARVAGLLRRKRHEQGGLEFEVPEVRIALDEKGDPVGVTVPVRNEAEMIIEDFMLAANEQVASFLSKKGASIFRIHASPDSEKLAEFVKFANGVGLGLRIPRENTPRAMQHLLEEVRANPHAGVLSSLLLRTMQKAVYSTDNPGHFGLAFADYTHFTSPIRRYPDLVVHRLLSSAIEGKKAYTEKELERIAEQATKMEQNAVDAEREYTRIKGARFLGKKTGEVCEGKVTSVTSWGMFITLLQWGLDGLLHISELRDDYYRLDTWGHTLVGERTGRVYSIGSVIRVRIKSVNAEKGFVDLVLEESELKGGKSRSGGGSGKHGARSSRTGSAGDRRTGDKNARTSEQRSRNGAAGPARTDAGRNAGARQGQARQDPGRISKATHPVKTTQPEGVREPVIQPVAEQEKSSRGKGWRFWKK